MSDDLPEVILFRQLAFTRVPSLPGLRVRMDGLQ
jgi:hypothetical protein